MSGLKKIITSYRGQLLELAKLYGIVEVKSYVKSHKRLTTSQLELLLIKNNIKLPINRSSARIIEKHEIKERSITNIYLSLFFLFFIGCMIMMRPYIKNVVNEVRFASITAQYTQTVRPMHEKFVEPTKSYADIIIPDDSRLSKQHFIIKTNNKGCSIKDLGSTNGTFLDGNKVGESFQSLKTGGIIRCGKTEFTLIK